MSKEKSHVCSLCQRYVSRITHVNGAHQHYLLCDMCLDNICSIIRDKQQKEYKVVWRIEVSATSPRGAAEEALMYIVHGDARVFEVTGPDGDKQLIDLAEDEDADCRDSG